MARFKLVGGKTYALPHLYGDRIFVKGDTTDDIVDEKVCDSLRDASYMDALNNTHKYWQELDEDGEAVEAKPAKARRTRPTAKSASEIEEV